MKTHLSSILEHSPFQLIFKASAYAGLIVLLALSISIFTAPLNLALAACSDSNCSYGTGPGTSHVIGKAYIGVKDKWTDWKDDADIDAESGTKSGDTMNGRMIDAVKMKLVNNDNVSGDICYRVYEQEKENKTEADKNGTQAGEDNKYHALEDIWVWLEGDIASLYTIEVTAKMSTHYEMFKDANSEGCKKDIFGKWCLYKDKKTPGDGKGWSGNTYTITNNVESKEKNPKLTHITLGSTVSQPEKITWKETVSDGKGGTKTVTKSKIEMHDLNEGGQTAIRSLKVKMNPKSFKATFWGQRWNSDLIEQRTVTYGAALGALPVPTKTGYIFTGWFTAASGGTQISANTTMPGANVNYYAHWEPIKYQICYNINAPTPNGGTDGTMPNSTFTYDTAGSLSANAFSVAGWKFKYWTKTPADSGSKYQNGYSPIVNWSSINGAVINLYAQWEPVSTYIEYVVDGVPMYGWGNSYPNWGQVWDVPQVRTTAATKLDCHHMDGSLGFDGWYFDSDYTQKFSAQALQPEKTYTLYACNWATVKYEHGQEAHEAGDVEYRNNDTGAVIRSGSIDNVFPLPQYTTEFRCNESSNLEHALDYKVIYRKVLAPGRKNETTLYTDVGWNGNYECSDEAVTAQAVQHDKTFYKRWNTSSYDRVETFIL